MFHYGDTWRRPATLVEKEQLRAVGDGKSIGAYIACAGASRVVYCDGIVDTGSG